MQSAMQSSGKSTGNKKRIRPAIPESETIEFSLLRTDRFDEGIAVLEEFDKADWMSWK